MELKNLGKSLFLAEWGVTASEESIKDFLALLAAHPKYPLHEFCLAVPYIYFESVASMIDHSRVLLGCSEMNSADPGTFTASIAGHMLKRKGAAFALIGAAKNRLHRHETNESVNYKVLSALAAGVTPFLCLGETDLQLQEKKSREVIREQFKKGIFNIASDQLSRIAIVLEAPWVQTTLDQLAADRIIEQYALYHQVIEECVGGDIATELRFFYRFSDEIENFENVYRAFRRNGFYSSRPESLLSLLEMAADSVDLAEPMIPTKTISSLLEHEIPLPLDVSEFEREFTYDSIAMESLPVEVPEGERLAGVQPEEGPPPAVAAEEAPPPVVAAEEAPPPAVAAEEAPPPVVAAEEAPSAEPEETPPRAPEEAPSVAPEEVPPAAPEETPPAASPELHQ